MLKTHKDLLVWQKAFRLCLEIYQVSKSFPLDERFGLTAQLRRAALSVPSNIAEGYNRATRPDYIRFLWVAYGSLAELETQMLIAKELRFSNKENVHAAVTLIAEVERMLKALINSLTSKASKS